MIPVEAIRRAQAVIAGTAVRTPLLRLHAPEVPAEIYLKLESLQPIGSFKIRGAYNAIRQADPAELAQGVVTASAGNMAQGVAWAARELDLEATIVVPEAAPRTKLEAIERLGGRTIPVPFERWWQTLEQSRFDGVEGFFVHPVQDELVMAGNGTIGLEILEDLPDAEAVLIPWGGGGLTVGIASALRALRPDIRVYPVEPETAAPLSAALTTGAPTAIDYRPSFIDGAGARALLPAMWERAQSLVDGSFTVSLAETSAAIRFLAERARVIAEGAGALAPAVALSGRAGERKLVCVVSGGNIDSERLVRILAGETP